MCATCFAGRSCSAANECALLPRESLCLARAVLTVYKVRKWKDCPGPQKLDLPHLSLFPLKLSPLDSQGLFHSELFCHFADFPQCIGLTSQSPGVSCPPINWHLMSRWCKPPGSNSMPGWVDGKEGRKQFLGKGQIDLGFVQPMLWGATRKRLVAIFFLMWS